MFPEAGGSSSFARHAFNDSIVVLRRLGAVAGLHPDDRDLRLLRSVLRERAARPARSGTRRETSSLRSSRSWRSWSSTSAASASRPRSTSSSRWSTSAPSAVVILGAVLVLNPSLLVHQVHLGTAPSVTSWSSPARSRCSPTRASRPSRTWPRRPRTPGSDVPRAVNLVLIAVLAVYMGISVVALSALPVTTSTATT